MEKNIYGKYVNRRGYIIRKSELNENELKKIKKDLLVSPYNPIKNKLIQMQKKRGVEIQNDKSEEFKIYSENDNKVYLPIYYAREHFGEEENNSLLTEKYTPIDILFHGSLRQPQQEVVTKAFEHLKNEGGGLLQLRCGFGKTILALYLFSILKVKTLVIVHKEFLMTQWKERIEQFLPEAKIGTLRQSNIDIEGKDIVIGMLQSIATKKYGPEIFSGFGMCCFDECHHLGATVFSQAMDITRTRYMLGLSATPDRKDGLRKVFDYQLGEVICKVDAKVTHHVEVKTVDFNDPNIIESEDGNRVIVYKNKGKYVRCLYNEHPQMRVKLIGHVTTSEARMELIMKEIVELCEEPLRRILILSERRNHLKEFGTLLEEKGIDYGFYWGGEKQAKLDEASTKKVILGTYHMASEGMDIPELNTVILASPKSDVKQSVGRILRKTDHGIVPLVIDIVDKDLPCFRRQLNVRKKLYASCGFKYFNQFGQSHETSHFIQKEPKIPKGKYLFTD
jgi:superfamily II DNA or RNA helicase